jgi:uncharacterized protein (TIGR02757 family)
MRSRPESGPPARGKGPSSLQPSLPDRKAAFPPRQLELPPHQPSIATFLEDIHNSCNRLARLDRDPLALVRPLPDPADREVAGLVASTLAFGSVDLILRAAREALGPLGDRPASALAALSEKEIRRTWAGFQYRFCFPKDLIGLLIAIRRARADRGSLESLFVDGDPGGEDIVDATAVFVKRLRAYGDAPRGGRGGSSGSGDGSAIRAGLLPDPERGSACKRLFLYLRWMVREDEVDPGGWSRLDRARLVVPIDIHMARVCSERLHFIPRPVANLAMARRATAAFRLYAPEDPVKYDFALTRPGIDPKPGDERWDCA